MTDSTDDDNGDDSPRQPDSEGRKNRPPPSTIFRDALVEPTLQARAEAKRLPRVHALARIVSRHGGSVQALLGSLAGALYGEAELDAELAVRRSAAVRLGLVSFAKPHDGGTGITISWPLKRLLQTMPASANAILDGLAGPRQIAQLGLEDFAHVADADFLVRLLQGALAEGAVGINLLIHGPVGTGKTEFTRTLASAAGATSRAVAEADDDGDEPTRWERVSALLVAQKALAHHRHTVLLFDEMEDLTGDGTSSPGGSPGGRQGSKVFVNRLLETNPRPMIWITNAIDGIDPALLRRMSHILDMATRHAVLPSPWPRASPTTRALPSARSSPA